MLDSKNQGKTKKKSSRKITKGAESKAQASAPLVNVAMVSETRELLLTKLAELAAVFSTPARLGILMNLSQGPLTVEEIAMSSNLSVANTSQHLQKMTRAKLLKLQKIGVKRIYSMANLEMHKLLVSLQDAAREIFAEVRVFENALLPQPLLAKKGFSEVRRDVTSRKAQLLDVRSLRESNSSRVKESLHVPVSTASDLPKAALVLKKNLPVYVFCRGAYCATAAATAGFLREHGFDAYCLRQTGADWMIPGEEDLK
jgi:rhodanese-related sulfurtransferase/DNA-binding transcriptional ArsR family regulator